MSALRDISNTVSTELEKAVAAAESGYAAALEEYMTKYDTAAKNRDAALQDAEDTFRKEVAEAQNRLEELHREFSGS